MPRGTVKWFNAEKGYGFIRQDNGGKDVFVHRTAVDGLGYNEQLQEGELVEFEIEQGPKGLQAIEVARLGGA
jgi:cold shock protein